MTHFRGPCFPRRDVVFGVKLGLNQLTDDYGVLAGVTFRW